jgi:hypothetical protein
MVSRTIHYEISLACRRSPEEWDVGKAMDALKTNRDDILSAILILASRVLKLREEGYGDHVLKILNRVMPGHSKDRCNPFLVLVCLMRLAWYDRLEGAWVDELDMILQALQAGEKVSNSDAAGEHRIGVLISNLLMRLRGFHDDDDRVRFVERYGLRVSGSGYRIENMKAGSLYASLNQFGRDIGLPLSGISGPISLGRRINSDQKAIQTVVGMRRHMSGTSSLYSFWLDAEDIDLGVQEDENQPFDP